MSDIAIPRFAALYIAGAVGQSIAENRCPFLPVFRKSDVDTPGVGSDDATRQERA